jgi:hypothetical protein
MISWDKCVNLLLLTSFFKKRYWRKSQYIVYLLCIFYYEAIEVDNIKSIQHGNLSQQWSRKLYHIIKYKNIIKI